MNKRISSKGATAVVAVAFMGIAGSSAMAQQKGFDVKVYGIIDVAAVSADSGYGRTTTINGGGGMAASRLGIQMSKDMAGGLKALGLLEGGLQTGTGTLGGKAGMTLPLNTKPASSSNAGDMQIFARQAYAGLSGEFGKVTVGRQYTGSYLAIAGVGSAYSDGLVGQAATFSPLVGGMPTRVNNSVRWDTPKLGDITSILTYTSGSNNNASADTVSGTTKTNSTAGTGFDAALLYNKDKFNAAFSTWNVKADSYVAATEKGLATKTGYQLGANYDFSTFRLHGSYVSGKIKGGSYETVTKTLSDSNATSVSALIPVSKAGKVNLTYTKLNDKSLEGKDASLMGVSYLHALDDQASLYASYGKMKNNSVASYQLIDAGNITGLSTTGFSPTMLMVGYNMRF